VSESDTLFTLAEISVAMAGFSAIVVLFRRLESGLWRAADADRLHGMVLHSMFAGFFCLLPPGVRVFTGEAPALWGISSAALGLQILSHLFVIVRLPSTTRAQGFSIGSGALVALLQLANVLGVAFEQDFGPYLIGILWHVIQAGVLFLMLIWIPGDEIDAG